MNKENLIKDTFEKPFNEERYAKFLSELLNTSVYSIENISDEIDEGFDKHIECAYDYGLFNDINEEELKLFVVKLKKNDSLERARTMQRNFIAKLLSKQWIDNALVAFYDDNEDWRFSFIKIDYDIDEKGNVIKKLTPAKRYSYLVGPTQSNHTCQQQFIKLIVYDEVTVENIHKTFNVEKVTDEFFIEYKNLFHKLTESINKVKKEDIIVKEEFDSKNIQSTDFAKKILGQIVFLYFIQKKGWLGVSKNDDWGDGPKDFIRRLWKKEYVDYENFFDDVLEYLFYEGLSTSSVDYHYSKFKCKIPFINGGLFENINNYDWKNTALKLNNSIFKEIIDTFDRFNFTVKEDEPLEKEVAIDPEMLGKVFERLLDVTERKDEGEFYTPRPIVHEMCQKSLIYYLYNNTEEIPINDISDFITKGFLTIDSIIEARESDLSLSESSENILIPNSVLNQKDIIGELLDNVKIVDPAVGSGAFPVGMLNELVQAKTIIRLLQGITDIDTYDLKLETIENSLYAVDLSYSATDITKLRFWLSLIVDEESVEDIHPLPNLDNKIMCGNSVVDSFGGIKLFNKELLQTLSNKQTSLYDKKSEIELKKLEREKSKYFDENNHEEKIKRKNTIQNIKWNFIEETVIEDSENNNIDALDLIKTFKYKESKPFFIWELEFSEIFKGNNPGFDIVIGNPPYVDLKERMTEEIIEYYKNTYENAEKRQDLFLIFIEKSKMLLKNNGILSFIIPNSYLLNESYCKSRKDLYDNYSITNIYRVPKVFDAIVDPIIITFTKYKLKENTVTIKIFNENSKDQTNFKEYITNIITQNKLFNKDTYGMLIYQETNTKSILKKIESQHPTLQDIYSVNLGLTPYDANRSLSPKVIEEFNKNTSQKIPFDDYNMSILKKMKKEDSNQNNKEKINLKISRLKEKYKKEIMEPDLFKSEIDDDKTCKKLISGENIKKYYINWFNRNGYVRYGNWLGSSRKQEIFTEPRVLIRQIITNEKIYAGYTEEELYNSQIGFNVIKYPPSKKLTEIQRNPPVGLKYVLAIINSKVMNYYHTEKFLDKHKKDQQKILVANAKKFPIVIPKKDKQLSMINSLVNEMILTTNNIQKIIEDYHNFVINNSNIMKITSRSSKELYEFYNYSLEEHYKKIKNSDDNAHLKDFEKEFSISKENILDLSNKQEEINNKLEEEIFDLYELSDSEKYIISSVSYNN